MNKIKNLRNFSAFLLQENRLEEVVRLNIKAVRKNHSVLLDKLGPLTEEEITQIFTISFGSFLKDVSENKGFDNILDSFNNWKKNSYGMLTSGIQATDIMMAYEVRKDVLIKMIPEYTTDPAQNIEMREEIDALFFLARKTGMNFVREKRQGTPL